MTNTEKELVEKCLAALSSSNDKRAELRLLLAQLRDGDARHRWLLTINDGYGEFTYGIMGTGDKSVYQVAQNAATFLEGTLIK